MTDQQDPALRKLDHLWTCEAEAKWWRESFMTRLTADSMKLTPGMPLIGKTIRVSSVCEWETSAPDLRFVVGEGGRLPTRGTPGSAGLDLYAAAEVDCCVGSRPVVVPTRVQVAIPPGYVGLIRGRSGQALQGRSVVEGTIDSDYRGEVGVIVRVGGPRVMQGDRIAQLVIVPCHMGEPVAVDELDDTERGSGGFGSTGR